MCCISHPQAQIKILLLQNTDEVQTSSGVVLDLSILVRYNLTVLLIC